MIRARAAIPHPVRLLSSWKLSVVLMVAAGLYYAFLAIFATMSPAAIVASIATLIPFWAVYVLILLNTAVCIWRRLPGQLREIGPTPLADHARARWSRPAPAGASRKDVERLLRARGYTVRPRETEGAAGLVGVRRRWGALGTTIFHGAFLLVASGLFFGFAYRDEVKAIVAEGEEFTGAPGQLQGRLDDPGAPFRVDAIEPAFWGDQLLFTSLTADVTLDDGVHKQMRINRPLWTGFGRFVRLSNFGYAPVYELRDGRDRMLDAGVVKLSVFPAGQRDHFQPAGFPHRVYVQVFPDAEVRGEEVLNRSHRLVAPVLAVRVTRGKLTVAKALLAPGEDLEFEGKRLRFPAIRYFGEFSLLTDPGAPLLFGGFLIGFAGLLLRAGGRRAEIAWTPGDDARGGELRGFGEAEPPDADGDA